MLRFLRAFERVQEQLHPAKFTQFQADLSQTVGEMFVRLRSELNDLDPPLERQDFHRTWLEAVGLLDTTYGIFVRSDQGPVLWGRLCRAARPSLGRAIFCTKSAWTRPCCTPTGFYRRRWRISPKLEKRVPAQQHRVGISHHPPSSNHGAYSLYVPEHYNPQRHWPLIIALHGAGGANDEYLLTWLRPAKSKGYIVLAPKSLGLTWTIEKPEPDVVSVTSTLMALRERYAIESRPDSCYRFVGRRDVLVCAKCQPTQPLWRDCSGCRSLAALAGYAKGRHPALSDYPRQPGFYFSCGGCPPGPTPRLSKNGLKEVTFTELPEWGHALYLLD